jgi:hypothetical protein
MSQMVANREVNESEDLEKSPDARRLFCTGGVH